MNAAHPVLIVEDDPVVRERLVEAVREAADFEVLAAVGSLHAARSVLGRRLPALALVDLGLPDGEGSSLIDWLAAQPERVEILVLTLFADERHVVGAIRAGASGYLLKHELSDEIVPVLRRVMAGESPISSAVARYILRLARPGPEPAGEATAGTERLTATELEVLRLLAKGFSAREIAQMTGRSPTTVPVHVRNIYRKLAVHSRGEAVFEAMQLGLIARPPAAP